MVSVTRYTNGRHETDLDSRRPRRKSDVDFLGAIGAKSADAASLDGNLDHRFALYQPSDDSEGDQAAEAHAAATLGFTAGTMNHGLACASPPYANSGDEAARTFLADDALVTSTDTASPNTNEPDGVMSVNDFWSRAGYHEQPVMGPGRIFDQPARPYQWG